MTITKRLALMLQAIVCLIVFLTTIGSAQQQERLIDKQSWPSEPIKIVRLKTKDRPVELGKKFSEEDDWLKGLTVTVENISNKAIARIEIDLTFPRAEGGSPPEIPILVTQIGYGKDPADVSADEVLKLVLAGESVDIKIPEANLPFINKGLKELGYPEKAKHAQLIVQTVTFSDGSEWAAGEMFYPDPNNPKQKLNPRFPAKVSTNKYSEGI
jgi:hypothetical protein